MDIVIYLAGAVTFFVLVMASIALHEIGHLVPGKLFDVKTTQYFVGFGRTLWSRHRGETEYGIKAIPLGGYVRFVGMYPPSKATGKIRASRTGIFQSLADQARAAEWEDIRPEDDGRLFYQKKSWQKLIIMAAGPTMNIILAFVIMLAVTGLYGVNRYQLQIAAVSECIVPAARASQVCEAGDPKTPAYLAGAQAGDVVVAFNGIQLKSWEQLSELIRANLDRPVQVTVHRDGQLVQLAPTSTVLNDVRSERDPAKFVSAGFFGVTPAVERERGGPVVVVADMWRMAGQTFVGLSQFPVKVYNVAANLLTGKPRDAYGPMSIVGASRVAGEVASTKLMAAPDKVAGMFVLLGSINLFVALFNFVPLMPLDGGHILGAIYEGLKRLLARLRGRPDPGYVDTAKMLPVAYVVGGIIALSGVVLILADIIDPIKIF